MWSKRAKVEQHELCKFIDFKCSYNVSVLSLYTAGIEEKGTKISLKVTDITDLSRDVLKVVAKYFFSLNVSCSVPTS